MSKRCTVNSPYSGKQFMIFQMPSDGDLPISEAKACGVFSAPMLAVKAILELQEEDRINGHPLAYSYFMIIANTDA